MTNDEKYTKVAQALQKVREANTYAIAADGRVAIVTRAVRTIDACNAMLSHVSVDDTAKLFDLIAGDKP